MRFALVVGCFAGDSGVPALAVKSVRVATGGEASLSHPTEIVLELRHSWMRLRKAIPTFNFGR